ncbi:hypothetical protein OIU76_006958 [Salix suchowensis]|nr:hypothetical protein OIU76_006958 [Salix suchowensis]
MEKQESKQASMLMWVLVASLLSQYVAFPVLATTFEDQKNFYFPDPHSTSPPSGSQRTPSHGTTPSHGSGGSSGNPPSHSTPSDPSGGGYKPTPSTPSGGNCGTPPSVPTPSKPSNPPRGGYHPTPSYHRRQSTNTSHCKPTNHPKYYSQAPLLSPRLRSFLIQIRPSHAITGELTPH